VALSGPWGFGVGAALPLAIYATVLGLIAGSYLNVVIHRLPRGVSTVLPPSSCPGCGVRIRARDNVPVFSFLFLRGRCRNCRRSIGWRYPMVEAATGILFLACYLRFGASWSAVVAALFGASMIALALIDLEHFILPDRITLPGIAIGLLVQPLVKWVGLPWALVGAAVGAGVILLMNAIWKAIRGVPGFGLGDVKMLAMIGAFLGLSGVVVTLFLGALLGSVTGMALMARKRIHMQSKLPFGFFLAIGAIAALFYGGAFVDWYLSFFP
jgi:leader peptidase (prepilin peptidase)/N-methyltransferase